MKKIFALSLLAFGLVGCETYQERAGRVPYNGFGEYGFTYDLDSQPTLFDDTSYRPLTPYDLAAPIIVVVTNQPPARIVYKETPSIGETRYSGETPTRAAPVITSPTIIESAGAPANPEARGTAGAGTIADGTGASAYGGPGYDYEGNPILFAGTNGVSANTNQVVTNLTSTNINGITNTNAFGFVTNNNGLGGGTNTNSFAGGTNQLINEPAGTELQTNRPFDQPPGTPFRTNQFGEPAAPPKTTTNAPINIPNPQPPPVQPQAPQVPAPRPSVQTPPAPSAPQNQPAAQGSTAPTTPTP